MSNVINVDFSSKQRGFSFHAAQQQEIEIQEIKEQPVIIALPEEEEEYQPRYIDFPEKFEVGQRIYCMLYGGTDGTIIAIHGEQRPGSISTLSSIMVTGGNAELDIAWDTCGERGGFSRRTPECIARGVQWQMLSGHRDVNEAIAESEAYIAAEVVKKEAGKIAFNKAMDKARVDYSYLTEDNGSDRNIIQKNLRAMLKKRFPDTKFQVTKDGYSARNVYWVDGPTTATVKQVTNLFEEGSFNGMEDIYEYNSSPFNSVFGGCQYIFEHREFSDEFVAKAIDDIWEQHGANFEGDDKPPVEMYRKGGLRNIYSKNLGKDFSEVLWEKLNSY